MTTLAEALAAEREKRRREAEDSTTRREVGRAVLQALAQRLNAEPLPTWFFISKGDEILVAHTKNGAASRQHVGSWVVDGDMRLVLDQEMTEWITAESCARVVDEAVQHHRQVHRRRGGAQSAGPPRAQRAAAADVAAIRARRSGAAQRRDAKDAAACRHGIDG